MHKWTEQIEELAAAGFGAERSGLDRLKVWVAGQDLGEVRLEMAAGGWVFTLRPAGTRRFRPSLAVAGLRAALGFGDQWPAENREAAERLDFVWAAERLFAIAEKKAGREARYE